MAERQITTPLSSSADNERFWREAAVHTFTEALIQTRQQLQFP